MVDLALGEIKILEDLDLDDIVVSVKAFDVPTMVAAYRRLAKAVPYRPHLGVTEAGTLCATGAAAPMPSWLTGVVWATRPVREVAGRDIQTPCP